MVLIPGMVAFAQAPSAGAAALVKEAVAFAKQNGMAKLIQETNQPKGRFHVNTGSELYIFIYNERGVVKAIGYDTEALVGVNRYNLRDPDGFLMVREFINVAQNRGKGWVDYKYPNPTTGKIEQKTSYLEFFEDMIIGSGAYKD
ncbi:MAG: cache domain-containing protein [Holophaga sp.]|nr:cache domain-containing protein [Holophaga sp.]